MIRPESFIFRSIKYVTSLNRRKLKSNNGFYVSFRTINSHDFDRWWKPKLFNTQLLFNYLQEFFVTKQNYCILTLLSISKVNFQTKSIIKIICIICVFLVMAISLQLMFAVSSIQFSFIKGEKVPNLCKVLFIVFISLVDEISS